MSVLRRAYAAALPAASAVIVAAAALVAPAVPARAALATKDVYHVPSTGEFLIEGHGFGHGIGMSQWGAYGAAVKGLGYRKILGFYYPHTTLGSVSAGKVIRVYLEGAGRSVQVAPRSSGKLYARSSAASPHECLLPHSLDGGKTNVTRWRAHVVSTTGGDRVRVQGTSDGTHWSRLPSKRCGADWAGPIDGDVDFDNGNATRLVGPGGATAKYRGVIRAAFTGGSLYGVNVVGIEDYTRGVTPSEMPASWSPAAVQAQAVAARTYGLHGTRYPKSAYFDVYPGTSDQTYGGVAAEQSASNDAVAATETTNGAGIVVRDANGHAALTQYSASNGGWTVAGAYNYLPAQHDPYDGVVNASWNPHTWRHSVSASTIEDAYGAGLGALQAIVVTSRDGNGAWGGRILSMRLRFAGGKVTVSPGGFCATTGLLNPWFHAMKPPGRPDRVTAEQSKTELSVSWKKPKASDRAPVTGYRVVLHPGHVVQHVSASTRSALYGGLSAGTDYTVSVSASSSVGLGSTATVTTKVDRLTANSAVGTAVAASKATFGAGKARSAVLANTAATASSYAAAPLARAHHGPVLLTATGTLPGGTAHELQRVLPAGGTVYLLGGTGQIGADVRKAVHALGYDTVRFDGSPDAVAVGVARDVSAATDVTSAFEVSRSGGPPTVWATATAAARHHGVLLLTDGAKQSPDTATWLSHHSGLKRFAIGSDAQQADPAGTAVGGTPVDVAGRFFPGPERVAVAAKTAPAAGLAAAGRMAARGGPVLAADATSLSKAARDYLAAARANIVRVDLVGPGMPYDDVERGIQNALVG